MKYSAVSELLIERRALVVSSRNLEASCNSSVWHRFASSGRFIIAPFIQYYLKILEHIKLSKCNISSDLFPIELNQQQSVLLYCFWVHTSPGHLHLQGLDLFLYYFSTVHFHPPFPSPPIFLLSCTVFRVSSVHKSSLM